MPPTRHHLPVNGTSIFSEESIVVFYYERRLVLMTKVSVYDLISDTGPFHRINLNLFCSGGVTTFPAGARYPSCPPHLLHNSRSLSVAPRPLDKTSWARGPEQDFYCVELYILQQDYVPVPNTIFLKVHGQLTMYETNTAVSTWSISS